jgi:Fe-S cluster biogenesis protein NfuA
MPELKDRVVEVLNRLRVHLQADGGDVELVDVTEDGVVKVRLTGTCKGCPFSQMTLQNMIETNLKKEIPEVKMVEGE